MKGGRGTPRDRSFWNGWRVWLFLRERWPWRSPQRSASGGGSSGSEARSKHTGRIAAATSRGAPRSPGHSPIGSRDRSIFRQPWRSRSEPRRRSRPGRKLTPGENPWSKGWPLSARNDPSSGVHHDERRKVRGQVLLEACLWSFVIVSLGFLAARLLQSETFAYRRSIAPYLPDWL